MSPTLKAKFETADHTNTDVVASGTGNTDFALQRTGFWLIIANIRFTNNAGGGERAIYIVNSATLPSTTLWKAHQNNTNVGNTPTSLNLATVVTVLTVPTTYVIGIFQSCGAALNTDVGFGGGNHVSFTWLGPP